MKIAAKLLNIILGGLAKIWLGDWTVLWLLISGIAFQSDRRKDSKFISSSVA